MFLSDHALCDKKSLIMGDLNFHLDIPTDRDTILFNSILDSCSMKQHVYEPTHLRGHTLDVVITKDDCDLVSDISVTDPGLCDESGNLKRDHFAVSFCVSAAKPTFQKKTITYRKLRAIDINSLNHDLSSLNLNDMLSANPEEFLDAYIDGLTKLVDQHAPARSKTITLRPNCAWFTDDLHDAKHHKRRLERKWKSSKTMIDHQIYHNLCSTYNKMLTNARTTFYLNKIESCGSDSNKLFKIANQLLGDRQEDTNLPSGVTSKEHSQNLSDYFISKIDKIRFEIGEKKMQHPKTRRQCYILCHN